MIDITGIITSKLKETTNLDVVYELFADSSTNPLPCITYQIYNDYDVELGDSITYSKVQYMIKLWGEIISSMTVTKREIDECMHELGFERISYGELTNDNQICMMMVYEGLAKEPLLTTETGEQ